MRANYSVAFVVLSLFIACHMSNENTTDNAQTTTELNILNKLLRDPSFAAKIASYQEAAYAGITATKQNAPDTQIKKSFKEEKIATNLAGFYAVECGIGAISKETGKKPIAILRQIVDNSLDANQVLLLNRFANATWKAGQPFRGLDRIKRSTFTVATFLSKEEVKKDWDQVVAAATILLGRLNNTSTEAPAREQFEAIEKLMKDKAFAGEIAAYMEAAYYKGLNEPAPPFMKPEEDIATITKSANEEQLAINIAGFYALECGVVYLSTREQQAPSQILKAIINDSLQEQDKELLERFANATWKAGQPFRGLDRITRKVFKPFDLLPADEVVKDWKQIQMAAEIVDAELTKGSH